MTFYNRDKFQIKFTDDIFAPMTGLGFIGQLLLNTNFDARFDSLKAPHGKQTPTHSAVFKAMIGLIAEGVVEFEEIDPHKDKPSFFYLLQSPSVPSKETLHQRLDNLAQFEVMQSRLYDVSQSAIQQFGTLTPLDSVSLKVHVTGTPAFLKTAIARSQALTPHPLCVRMDAGNDSKENLVICQSMGVDYLIKRNIRNEPPQAFVDEAKALEAQPIPDAHEDHSETAETFCE